MAPPGLLHLCDSKSDLYLCIRGVHFSLHVFNGSEYTFCIAERFISWADEDEEWKLNIFFIL